MEVFDSVMALLFVADEPVKTEVIARTLNLGDGQVEQAIEILQKKLGTDGPLQIVRLAGGWQLSTKPECAEVVAAFLKPQRQRLGRSLMEVLAIVAYRQPITMAEIDVARGVQSDYSLRQLLERRLIEEVGRRETPGRPILYGTTQQFLHQFNLNSLEDLPELSAELTDLAGVAALTVGEHAIEEEEGAELEAEDELNGPTPQRPNAHPNASTQEGPNAELLGSPEPQATIPEPSVEPTEAEKAAIEVL